METINQFGIQPVSCHSWDAQKTCVALSTNDRHVQIYTKKGECKHTLTEHSQKVTSIDWAANANKIVTCGVDRNAYVWNFVDGKWKPELVVLRINRAATYCRWSPQENKFAVGTGSRLISVCYYDKEQNFWVSKQIKKPIRSTVTCVDWHPNNILLAAGSTDFKCRVFSAYIKEVEPKPSATSWGSKMTFGHLMCEYGCGSGGWVNSVSFSPSGGKVAWVAHNSSIHVVDSEKGMQVATLNLTCLPFMTCKFVDESKIVAAGFDYYPMVFVYDESKNAVHMGSKVDSGIKKAGPGKMSAMDKFRNLDKRATADSNKDDTATIHKNSIIEIRTIGDNSHISTCGLDGRLVTWNLQESLSKAMSGLKL